MEMASDPPCFLLHFFAPSTPSSNIVELSGALRQLKSKPQVDQSDCMIRPNECLPYS